jgi:multidrug resistance efflux pump
MFLIGGLIFTMNYNHPYSEITRGYFVTTPIVPTVSGKVISVAADGNRILKAGDELFRVDPRPYQNDVDALVPQLELALEDLSRAEEIMARGVGRQRDVDLAQTQVENITAQLATAEFRLSETVVYAATDGYATQVALRPGMMAVAMPLRPVMIFVHQEELYYVAWFRQNSLLRLEAGNEAEIAFDGLPGQVFAATVEFMLPAMVEGQITASGTLVGPNNNQKPGRIPVVIRITDEEFAQYANKMPGGSFAQAAIYSEHFHHVAIIRKVLLRMASWMNYLFPFH